PPVARLHRVDRGVPAAHPPTDGAERPAAHSVGAVQRGLVHGGPVSLDLANSRDLLRALLPWRLFTLVGVLLLIGFGWRHRAAAALRVAGWVTLAGLAAAGAAAWWLWWHTARDHEQEHHTYQREHQLGQQGPQQVARVREVEAHRAAVKAAAFSRTDCTSSRALGSIRWRMGLGYTPIHRMQASNGTSTAISRSERSASFSLTLLSSGLNITRCSAGSRYIAATTTPAVAMVAGRGYVRNGP